MQIPEKNLRNKETEGGQTERYSKKLLYVEGVAVTMNQDTLSQWKERGL